LNVKVLVIAGTVFATILTADRTQGSTPMFEQSGVSAAAIGTFSDLVQSYVFVVGRNRQGELETSQFVERRPDLGEMGEPKRVPWDVTVESGARFMAPTAGGTRDQMDGMWAAWTISDRYFFQSLYVDRPTVIALSGAQLVVPPVALSGHVVRQFLWSALPGRPAQLDAVEFTAGPKGPVTERRRIIATEPGRIVSSVAAAVPGGPRDIAMVAWLADTAGAYTLSVVTGTERPVLTALPSDVKPLARQRIALLGRARDSAAVRFFVYGRDGRLRVMQANCGDGVCRIQEYLATTIPADEVVSAANFFYLRTAEPRGFGVVVTNRGALLEVTSDGVTERRTGVRADWDIPIVTTLGARYEAVLDAQGQVQLQSF
jgi:hypothetical protein